MGLEKYLPLLFEIFNLINIV
jgi:hypothetical protein